ncbi:S8 family serine peptidase [Actinospica durhamensis]|uniref:S8 family serine peptidase n=1 Tax=Actinospica durhamensis TaxID=1508375 RepID=A0A941EK50_9ACTN|nr:S8 family serine peptidase [Actinospica durhamensis]MBR7832343.1 S8 family serine peptidase [Actinospica durhamensis]
MSSEDSRERPAPTRRRTRARIRTLAGVTAAALALCAVPASASGGAWYLDQFDMNAVWRTSTGSGVVVAEVDTGVNAGDHDLSGRLWAEIGLQGGALKKASGDSSASYDGTQVATLVAGNGSGGSKLQGLAPKATVLPIQIQDSGANGIAASDAAAIHYAVAHNVRIILFPTPLPRTSPSFEAAVKYAVTNNAIVIAAAGNNGSDAVIGDPCAAAGTLCISATTSAESAAAVSSVGPDVTLGAPGDQIPVPAKKGGVSTGSSTHYSAALAAGEAALVWAAHPDWTAGQVVRVMLNTAKDGNAQHTRVDDSIGYGIIDPAAAVAASAPPQVTNPLLPVVPTSSPSTAGANPSRSAASHSTAAAGSSSSGPWLGLGLGFAALVVVGAGVVFLRRRRPGKRNYYAFDPSFMPPTHQVEVPNPRPQSPGFAPPGQAPHAAPQQPYGIQYGVEPPGAQPPTPASPQSPPPWPPQQS